MSFNPVKEDKDGVRAKRVIWSTEALSNALTALGQGKKLVANPFYSNMTPLLKGDLVFKRTPAEIEEWKKCKDDILYFAEKYCKLLTPEGIKHIKLRDYQERYLTHLMNSQLSIYLACRQASKCVDFTTKVHIKIYNTFFNRVDPSKAFKIKRKWDKKYKVNNDNEYYIPLFEIYSVFDTSFKWKIKQFLYGGIGNKYIDKVLYKLLPLLNDEGYAKFINSHLLDGCEVLDENGFINALYIHETRPYKIYTLRTLRGKSLITTDDHILIKSNRDQIMVKDLTLGDEIISVDGIDTITNITISNTDINMCDISVGSAEQTFFTNGLLSHNTTMSAIFLLHYIIFNVDKNSLVLGNKRKTACEILDKIKKIYLNIPYFLKPGIYKWNEGEISLDNGCKIMAEATTINSGISFTFHCVLCDEFAHVPKNILDEFYNNIFPTITAGKARFMITSTQKGYNLFYRLYKAAEAGDNDYKPFKTDWYEVPEWNPETHQWDKRDDEWKRRQVANYGSEEAFNKQFGTDFDVSAMTLISKDILSKRQREVEIFVNRDLPGLPCSEMFKWKPGYNPATDLRKDYILITCDIAEGGGNDYTVFNIFRLAPNGVCECIGYFRSNKTKMNKCSQVLLYLYILFCNPNHTLISLEYNTYGELFINYIYNNVDKNKDLSLFDTGSLIRYYKDTGSSTFKLGIKITVGNKTPYCLRFKESFESNKIVNTSAVFVSELTNFCNDGKEHYKASFGHDDIVMTSVQLEFAKDTLQYKMMREEYDALIESSTSAPTEYIDSYSAEMYNIPYGNYNDYSYDEDNDNLKRLNRLR